MNSYYDTGVLLKLYTAEPESPAVARFVKSRAERVEITDLHLAEATAALRLKVFRKECRNADAAAALHLIKEDLANGVLRLVQVDWNHVWHECRLLCESHVSQTGVRTLDALHVAAARLLEAGEFLTSDHRQASLARRIHLPVHDPSAPGS